MKTADQVAREAGSFSTGATVLILLIIWPGMWFLFAKVIGWRVEGAIILSFPVVGLFGGLLIQDIIFQLLLKRAKVRWVAPLTYQFYE